MFAVYATSSLSVSLELINPGPLADASFPSAFAAVSRKIFDFDCLDTLVLPKKLEKNRNLRCRCCRVFHWRGDPAPQARCIYACV